MSIFTNSGKANNSRRLLCFCVLLALMMAAAVAGCAATVVASGNCGANGDNVTWTLEDYLFLTISGTGEMEDFVLNYVPWDNRSHTITCAIISDGVTSIGDNAFANTNSLLRVTIPESIMSIGKSAFACCTNLNSITIPKGVTSIGDAAFMSCNGLTSIIIPDSVMTIGNYVFWRCRGLTSVTIPDSVTSIGEGAFKDCLSSLTINVVCSSYAHAWCVQNNQHYTASHEEFTDPAVPATCTMPGLTGRTYCTRCGAILAGQEYIPPTHAHHYTNGACRDCCQTFTSALTLTLPRDLTAIDAGAFTGIAVEAVVIPDGCTAVGEKAFADCKYLRYVFLPAALEGRFPQNAFEGCGQLEFIYQ